MSWELRSAGDVTRLLSTLPLWRWPWRVTMLVRAPELGDWTQIRWERRLGFWVAACGCQTGALLAITALVWRSVLLVHQPLFNFGALVTHFGWVFGAALLGKVLGLTLARLFLVRDLRRLRRQLSHPSGVPAEVVS